MASESTPLLQSQPVKELRKSARLVTPSIVTRLLFCAFLISLSIAFTQVPILYVFRLMTCDQYYKDHPPFDGDGDRCSTRDIEAQTASSVSLLGMTTTILGVINLIGTGWSIKRFGVKTALIQQTIFPSFRLICQIVGVAVGAKEGILIIQLTQLVCMFGGPSGYLLVLNTFASQVVDASERTAIFGKLQGSVMFGTAFGYLLGGLVGNFNIRYPFQVALLLMIASSVYSVLFLPSISSEATKETKESTEESSGFLAPIKILWPQRLENTNGRESRYYGPLLLGSGIFLGVLATGFIPTLIQMYATNAFGFHSKENGVLMATNALVRGLHLTFAFPRIISTGRKWLASTSTAPGNPQSTKIPTAPEHFEVNGSIECDQEPTAPTNPVKLEEGAGFDLFFLRFNLILDGLLTGLAAFSCTGWQIYVAACLLPLAAGSAPAAKGVMMEMCPPSKRSDALSAITLVEMIATLSTTSMFGFIFAALAETGKPHLVFFLNAGVAWVASVVLAFAHLPPRNSRLVESA